MQRIALPASGINARTCLGPARRTRHRQRGLTRGRPQSHDDHRPANRADRLHPHRPDPQPPGRTPQPPLPGTRLRHSHTALMGPRPHGATSRPMTPPPPRPSPRRPRRCPERSGRPSTNHRRQRGNAPRSSTCSPRRPSTAPSGNPEAPPEHLAGLHIRACDSIERRHANGPNRPPVRVCALRNRRWKSSCTGHTPTLHYSRNVTLAKPSNSPKSS